MLLTFKKSTAEAIGLQALHAAGLSKDGWWNDRPRQLDISVLPLTAVRTLRTVIAARLPATRAASFFGVIDTWLELQATPTTVKLRTLDALVPALVNYIRPAPHHALFEKDDDIWLAYFVDGCTFKQGRQEGDQWYPAYVTLSMSFFKLGEHRSHRLTFHYKQVIGKTVIQVLAAERYVLETPNLWAYYEAEQEQYRAMLPGIGTQYNSFGAVEDAEGFEATLGSSEAAARVVLDTFTDEDDDEEDGHRRRRSRSATDEAANLFFWEKEATKAAARKRGQLPESADAEDQDRDDDEDEGHLDDGLTPEARLAALQAAIVPTHAFVRVFNLASHRYYACHIKYLRLYKYDRSLADKLILPEELKSLVRLLIAHKEHAFEDIIVGKGGGAVVLLAGPPGTGKTLTAEVFAEAEERPLYSVQCAQLGLDAESLEQRLKGIFARASRWKAILMLDEADVYIRARGNDLVQNAIVGVFLRMLEYQSSILFMLTNRADAVDDAIASRCLAKIIYKRPEPALQVRIWEVLAQGTGATLAPGAVKAIGSAFPDLSGRDVKNLLKLAMMTAVGKPITLEMVRFVHQFKPTE